MMKLTDSFIHVALVVICARVMWVVDHDREAEVEVERMHVASILGKSLAVHVRRAAKF